MPLTSQKYLSPLEATEQARAYVAEDANSLCVFHSPQVPLDLALHRVGNRWYTVFPRAYGMAESRRVSSLNAPRASDPPTTAPPASLSHLRHRFWFNPDSRVLSALSHLLLADPPILRLTGTTRTEKSREADADADVDAPQVELLIGEEALSRRCATCGAWETTPNLVQRFYRTGERGGEAVYWCGYCDRSGTIWSAVSKLWSGVGAGDESIEYFR